MIKRLVHFSDLHIRLFKDHELYKSILQSALSEWKALAPDRLVFTGNPKIARACNSNSF